MPRARWVQLGWVWLVAGWLMLAGAAPAPASPSSGGGTFVPSSGGKRFAVGEIVVRYTDTSRRRTLVTLIRYPATGNPSGTDVVSAPPAKSAGPFPLIVFGHGFDITPAPYARLLRAWARAGYVVAAPIFPYSNADAPGGANESDLVNQPTDMSFVITRILAGDAAGHGIVAGLVARGEIAVAGQSDGGSTALAAAYNIHYRDRRIGAAMILSGARIPGVDGYDFAAGTPPLLAAQGTADTVNSPSSTYQYFREARQPKFLLSLLGAPHLGPYTNQQPQLGIVERVTVAFLDRFLKHQPAAEARMSTAGDVPHLATLSS